VGTARGGGRSAVSLVQVKAWLESKEEQSAFWYWCLPGQRPPATCPERPDLAALGLLPSRVETDEAPLISFRPPGWKLMRPRA
jgi:hypothetical protein